MTIDELQERTEILAKARGDYLRGGLLLSEYVALRHRLDAGDDE